MYPMFFGGFFPHPPLFSRSLQFSKNVIGISYYIIRNEVVLCIFGGELVFSSIWIINSEHIIYAHFEPCIVLYNLKLLVFSNYKIQTLVHTLFYQTIMGKHKFVLYSSQGQPTGAWRHRVHACRGHKKN